MFARWFSARRTPSPEFVEQDQDGIARPAIVFEPMLPVLPPGARNDDAIPSLHDFVEQDLKAAGYLA